MSRDLKSMPASSFLMLAAMELRLPSGGWPILERGAQFAQEVFVQGVEPDVLDWKSRLAMAVIASASAGDARMDPIGGLVTTSTEPPALHETLQQQRPHPVVQGEIGPDVPDAASQNHGCEIGRTHPGQNQKAPVVDHLAQARLFLSVVPSDETIPVGKGPGGGTEAQQGQQVAIAAMHEIAQLGSGSGRVAQVMMALYQLIP